MSIYSPFRNPIYEGEDQVQARGQVQDVNLSYSELDSDHKVFSEHHYQMLLNPLFQATAEEGQYAKPMLPPSRQSTDMTDAYTREEESIYQELD